MGNGRGTEAQHVPLNVCEFDFHTRKVDHFFFIKMYVKFSLKLLVKVKRIKLLSCKLMKLTLEPNIRKAYN